MPLTDELPAIYRELFPEEFLALKGGESVATCAHCAMCDPHRHPRLGASKPFSPHTKCCTFYPHVPNYLVGGILQAGGEGAQRVRQLIRQRQWVLPIGIVAPPSFQIKFTNKRPEQFGRDPDFLCPFFDSRDKGCSIWAFRDAECTTYFCAFDDGEVGRTRWHEIGERLHHAQMVLSQECMVEKGYSPAEIDENLRWIKVGVAPESDSLQGYELPALAWSRLWQHHVDRIEAYFMECYAWILKEAPHLRGTLAPIFAKSTP